MANGKLKGVSQAVKGASKRLYTAVTKSSPEERSAILDYISDATGGRIKTIEAVKGYVSGPASDGASAVVVAQGLARAGINPVAIMDDVLKNQNDAQLLALRNTVNSSWIRFNGQADGRSILRDTKSSDTQATEIMIADAVDYLRNRPTGAAYDPIKHQQALRLLINTETAVLVKVEQLRQAFRRN